MDHSRRLFFAIELPRPQRIWLQQLALHLAQRWPSHWRPHMKWVPEANLHITVQFVGDCKSSRAQQMVIKIKEALKSWQPLDLQLGKLNCFSENKNARILWVGFKSGTQALTQLSAELNTRLKELGFEVESRPYTPHLTLARRSLNRNSTSPEEVIGLSQIEELLQDFDLEPPDPFRVTGLSLMQSLAQKREAIPPGLVNSGSGTNGKEQKEIQFSAGTTYELYESIPF